MSSRSKPGLWVLLAKLGPKLWALAMKMHDALLSVVKPLFGVKAVGIVGSVGYYTYLFTWQMAVALVVFIGIHEYGHLFAMKKCGIKTKGMFFIPGFGAVAVAEERFGSAKNEAYIAIMGPVFGLVFFIFPMILGYWNTGNIHYAAIAAIMTFINLVNLFPINPLDGGRMLKSLAYSKRHALAFGITLGVSLITAVFGVAAGFYLLVYIAGVGFFEMAAEFGIKKYIPKLLATLVRFGLGCMIAIGVIWVTKIKVTDNYFYVGLTFLILFWIFIVTISVMEIKNASEDNGRSKFYYPIQVIKDTWTGLQEISKLRACDIEQIEDYTIMGRKDKTFYSFLFVTIVAIHVLLIVDLGSIPGADFAHEMMK